MEGIVRGVSFDGDVSRAEIRELKSWSEDHDDLAHRHPFREIIALLNESLSDGILDQEEAKDILRLCQRVRPGSEFFDEVTADIQRLQGILHGLLADGVIDDTEIAKLSEWLEEKDHLRGCFPFDEIDSLLTTVLADHVVDAQEREMLRRYFETFVSYSGRKQIQQSMDRGDSFDPRVAGICAVCPEIEFSQRTFCFTGISDRRNRRELVGIVTGLGGKFSNSLGRTVDYLVVCTMGNPCWAYSCYGRKVERAMKLRRQQHRIVIVHENDFMDAVLDV